MPLSLRWPFRAGVPAPGAASPPPSPGNPAAAAGRGEMERLRAEHAAAVQALQVAIRDTTRLTRLFSILNESGPLPKLLDRVLATLSELFSSDIVVLLEASGGGGYLPLAMIGVPIDTAREWIHALGHSRAVAAARAATPVVVPRLRADPQADACLRELDAETAVWLPVTGDEGVRGVLVLARCRPLPFERGDVDLLTAMAYRIGVMLDRAQAEQERQKLEARMRQAEKAESLGRMASAIAHHFNNMLLVVLGSLDMVIQDLPAGHRSREDVARAREAARRAAKTSGLMLAYLGQGVGSREPVAIAEVTRNAVEALAGTLPDHVRITVDLPEPDLIVVASAPQITQVLANLIVNAIEAMGDKPGAIGVAVRAVAAADIPVAQLAAATGKPEGGTYVCLEVADTGAGMSPETIGKAFDPFFTTKFIGRGLGLPVVLGTVRAHDGFISVQSTPGAGAIFRVYLPLATRSSAADGGEGTAAPAAPPAVRQVVLLVDDEGIVRQMAERVLGRLGHAVITAADGVEAMERFNRQQQDIELVILDLTTPRMDGWATLRAIRALRPGIPVILCSGYDESRVLTGQPLAHSVVFLHKPYTFDELRVAIRKALSGIGTDQAAAAAPPARSALPAGAGAAAGPAGSAEKGGVADADP